MKTFASIVLALVATMCCAPTFAGPLDPDCTAEKAAKSATAKATVGVGGRCSPVEAAKDSAKDAIGIEDKGPIERRHDDNDAVETAKGAVKKIPQ